MLEFLRENRRILVCTALALCAGVLLGLALRLPAAAAEPSPEAEQVGSIGEASILPTTAVERQVCYLACHHTVEQVMGDTSPLIGMTRQELAAAYPDAAITSFTAERVRLVLSVDGYCPAHLLLRADAQGTLAVWRMQEDALEMQPVLTLAATLDAFDGETAAALSEGVLFDSMDEINAYLESMES